jgi:DNA-binding transcriptional ArsR family regulator
MLAYMARMDSPEAQVARILSHPLRPRILQILALRGEASPNEIAAELDVPLGTLSYHTRLLRESGWIELVREVPRRGAVEHFYRAVPRPSTGETRMALELDEQGRKELAEVIAGAIEQAGRIQERANKRGGVRKSSELTILHFPDPAESGE